MAMRQKVKAGAALLDLHWPDWRTKITRPVSMAVAQDHLLTQIFGSLRVGLEEVRKIAPNRLAKLGFVPYTKLEDEGHEEEGLSLSREWNLVVLNGPPESLTTQLRRLIERALAPVTAPG